MAELHQTFDCIVVGGGYSGLAAAKKLLHHDASLRIAVLEAKDRVGGRAKTIHLDNGSYWDVGASFLGVGHVQMYALAKSYGIETFPIPKKGKLTYQNGEETKTYSGVIPPFGLMDVVRCGIALAQLERKVKKIDVQAPWAHAKAQKWDNITMADWLDRKTSSKLVREAMEMLHESLLGKPTTEFSLLHALYFFRTIGTVEQAISSDGGMQDDMIRGGGMAIASSISKELGDDVVKLNSAVLAVEYQENAEGLCMVHTETKQYTCKRIIFTTPPDMASKVKFTPALPPQKQGLLDGMSMGSYAKVYATYDKPFWRDQGLKGETMSLGTYFKITFDATLPDEGAPGKLTGFLCGDSARRFAELCAEEQRRVAISEFVNIFGEKAANPKDYFYHNMKDEKWSTGCPYASPELGVWSKYGEWIRKPVGPIHWAGTETSERYYGYMEGAVLSGFRAAEEVIAALQPVRK